MIQLAAASVFLKSWKVWAYAGALVLSFLVGWEMKSRSIVKQLAKQEVKAVVAAEKKGEKAVVKAVEDTGKLSALEKENEQLREQLRTMPDRVMCKPNTDELRILDDIQKSTE